MKPIKSLIAAVSALTLCITPFALNNAPAATVSYAASSTAGTASTLSIPDNNIELNLSRRRYGGGAGFAASGNGWDTSDGGNTLSSSAKYKSRVSIGWLNNGSKITKRNFYVTLQVPKSCTTSPRELIEINVQYQEGSHSEGSMTLNNEKLQITNITPANSSVNKYSIVVPFSAYGDKFKVNVDFTHNGAYTLQNQLTTVSSFAVSDADIGYTHCDATYSSGESIHMLLKTDGASTEETRQYMRMLCRYMNSLSDITGIKHKNIYVMFDEPHTTCPQCNHFVMSSDGTTVVVMMPENYGNFGANSGLISYKDTLKNCQLDWGLMHELAHCYSFTSKDSRFAAVYNYSLDDAHTNARGAVALQNCAQLRNIEVVLDGHKLGKYNTALTKARDLYSSDPIFQVIGVFGKYGSTVTDGWVKLEKYFSGTYNGENGQFESPNIINGVVYGAQEVIDEKSYYWYKDILFKSPDTYRFINSMYYLSKNAASNGYGASKENFKKFLKEFAGANVFANFVKSTNKSSLGEASVSKIKGDLNLDKKVNSTDITFANRYFADNYNANNNGLSPEGAFNFDMNSDGYINQEDLNQLKKLAK